MVCPLKCQQRRVRAEFLWGKALWTIWHPLWFYTSSTLPCFWWLKRQSFSTSSSALMRCPLSAVWEMILLLLVSVFSHLWPLCISKTTAASNLTILLVAIYWIVYPLKKKAKFYIPIFVAPNFARGRKSYFRELWFLAGPHYTGTPDLWLGLRICEPALPFTRLSYAALSRACRSFKSEQPCFT